jgi:preprotein translocase SecE subunit
MKNEKTSTFLNEVYAEAIKVIWPDKTDTNKQTIVIMIGVTIVGFILGFFDFMQAGFKLNCIINKG